jgi:hypothetical protein
MTFEILAATDSTEITPTFMEDGIILRDIHDGEQVVIYSNEFDAVLDAIEAILRKRNEGRTNEPTETVADVCNRA